MPRYFEYLSLCYRVILRFYPAELRLPYGDEMTMAFQQFVRDEYARAGVRGVGRASAYAFREFFTVALPRHLASEWLIAGVLSLAITTSVLGSLVGVMTARPPISHPIRGVILCR